MKYSTLYVLSLVEGVSRRGAVEAHVGEPFAVAHARLRAVPLSILSGTGAFHDRTQAFAVAPANSSASGACYRTVVGRLRGSGFGSSHATMDAIAHLVSFEPFRQSAAHGLTCLAGRIDRKI